MKNKSVWTLLGFVIFALGMLGICLNIVGVKLSVLLWMDSFGRLWSFVGKLVMSIVGVVIMVVSRTNFDGEEEIGVY